MARILKLLLVGVFLSSVGLWFWDQYKIDFDKSARQKSSMENIDFLEEDEEVLPYAYGFFRGRSEVVFYDDLNLSDIERLLDKKRIVVVLFDGSVLNRAVYNFSDVRFLALNAYDGDYFYTSKFGMPVRGGYVISRGDFRNGYAKAGGFVVDISF